MIGADAFPLSWPDYAAFTGYFVVLCVIGLWSGRKEKQSADDYFLAGRTLPWYVVGSSFVASNISTEHFIGMIGEAFVYGICVAMSEWSNVLSFSALIWFFIPFLLASRVFTTPEFMEKRFHPWLRQLFAVLTIVSNVVAFLAAVLYGGALALQSLFGWDLWPAIVLLGGVAGSWAIYGGLKSVAWTDFFTIVVMIVGGLMVTLLGLDMLSGDSHSLVKGWQVMIERNQAQAGVWKEVVAANAWHCADGRLRSSFRHPAHHARNDSVAQSGAELLFRQYLVQRHQSVHDPTRAWREKHVSCANGHCAGWIHEDPDARDCRCAGADFVCPVSRSHAIAMGGYSPSSGQGVHSYAADTDSDRIARPIPRSAVRRDSIHRELSTEFHGDRVYTRHLPETTEAQIAAAAPGFRRYALVGYHPAFVDADRRLHRPAGWQPVCLHSIAVRVLRTAIRRRVPAGDLMATNQWTGCCHGGRCRFCFRHRRQGVCAIQPESRRVARAIRDAGYYQLGLVCRCLYRRESHDAAAAPGTDHRPVDIQLA